MGCNVEIQAPDELGANLIAIELQRRGLEVTRNGNGVSTAVADRAAGDALAAAVGAMTAGARVTVDGGAAGAANGNGGAEGSFALVIGPSGERREKWDSVLRRVETQIGRDAGRPARRCGPSFSVGGYETREAAAAASAAVLKGLSLKLNFEDIKVAVVPEAAADLVVNVENDRRQLLIQIGYAAESACLLQIFVPDPSLRDQVRKQLADAAVKVAVCDERLVAGFANADDARALVKRIQLPASAAVQITVATASVFDLGSRLQRIHDDATAQRDLRLVTFLYWDMTVGGI